MVHRTKSSVLASSPAPLALIIEKGARLRHSLSSTLLANGYRVREAVSGEEGLDTATQCVPDLVVLDSKVPDMSGLEVTRGLRRSCRAPIIVISQSNRTADKVTALDGGADDYLTIPFSTQELLARMRVALRHVAERRTAAELDPFKSGHLHVDLMRRRVWASGVLVRLTPREYSLLSVLIENVDRVVPHYQLLLSVWGPNRTNKIEYLRVYMRSLRRKLEIDRSHPQILLSEPGVGYRLLADPNLPRLSGKKFSRAKALRSQEHGIVPSLEATQRSLPRWQAGHNEWQRPKWERKASGTQLGRSVKAGLYSISSSRSYSKMLRHPSAALRARR